LGYCFSGCRALAAALSTAAGLLLVISASVSHDIIKKMITLTYLRKMNFGLSRGAAAVVIIAGYFGINPPGFVAAVVALAFGLAACLIIPIIILDFDKKMNKEGAIAGMIIGLLLMLFYMKFKFGLLMVEKMLLLAKRKLVVRRLKVLEL
jgi:cation/acetate symporter